MKMLVIMRKMEIGKIYYMENSGRGIAQGKNQKFSYNNYKFWRINDVIWIL